MKYLNILLLFLPVTIAGNMMGMSDSLLFVCSALAIIPLAGIMGKSTDVISFYAGQKIGGLLNATFGNATELIIAFVAMKAGMFDVVKASLAGSVIGNILLVLGLSMLVGGLKYKTQSFNKSSINMTSSMLLLAVLGLSIPAIFTNTLPESSLTTQVEGLNIIIAVLMLLVYWGDRQHYYEAAGDGQALTTRMLRIALPLAVSAYARSALNTIQHLLVPRGLRASGFSADGALSGYGTIQGMALPVVLFPSCLLSAAAELVVPELTEAQMRGETMVIRRLSRKLLGMSLGFSCSMAAFLFLFADPLGIGIYKNADAGYYIRILAPLVPVMYTDMMVDGCLKGLGQQVWSMGINIIDSLTSLLLVWQFLPSYGLTAYLAIIYFTESLNFVLSLLRLRRCLRDQAVKP